MKVSASLKGRAELVDLVGLVLKALHGQAGLQNGPAENEGVLYPVGLNFLLMDS